MGIGMSSAIQKMNNKNTSTTWMPTPASTSNKTCFECKKKVQQSELVTCVRCNIILHNECEKNIRGDKGYCECPNPNCKRVGSLGYMIMP